MTIAHDPLKKEMLEHFNQYYQVVFIPEDARQDCFDQEGNPSIGNYEVRSRKYDVVEWRGCDLPSALIIAENFNSILFSQSWREPESDRSMMVDLTTKNKGTIQ